ncbi:MAG: aminotransferase class V-fold PLP-dependent enzyme [Deltaproteobacteria bacterium]|nr:aminotransferase class V-fold PLP-dependent enzyme [Deltaproteobacteria bacterium]
MSRIYMDHNATTPVAKPVLDAMWPLYSEHWGNPSSIHWAGREPAGLIDDARDQVADLIGARARDLFFTSGGTESDNTALMGVLAARPRGRHLVTSSIEHKAILDMAKWLETAHDVRVTLLGVDGRGRHDLDEVREAIADDTTLVSLMLANNEIGNINDITAISEIAHEHGALVHCDAVNALGKVPIDVGSLGVDLLSISAHKICGPKGCGALWVKRKTPFEPYIRGGGQERGRRCGTYNAAGIVGFGKAAALAGERLASGWEQDVSRLRDRLEEGIVSRVERVRVNGDPDGRLPNTTNLSFSGVAGAAHVLNLDLRGIAISTGSACTSGSLDPSHVLVALEQGDEWLAAAIRFSLGTGNDEAQVDEVIDAVVAEVAKLRALQATA